LGALRRGDVAVISEAGMPGLSDPGYELIGAAIERGHPVVPIPGPSAPLTALVVSGLPSDSFVYLGFLPRKEKERRDLFSEVARERRTLIGFEVPHRLRACLKDMEELLGSRPIAICRELTKLHEEVWRGTISQARAHFEEVEPRGEFTLVIGGAPEEERVWSEAEVRAALDEHMAQGRSPSSAARKVAKASGWNRRDVYRLTLEEE